MFGLQIEQGDITLHISEPGKTMPTEFWAGEAAKRIIEVANTAPQPIRDQALAFQGQVKEIINRAIVQAVHEQKMNDAHRVERVSAEAAEIIRGG